MSFFNFPSLLKRVPPRRAAGGGQRGSRRRASLRLDHLEDRLAPAVSILNTPGSFATIQAAVNAANPGDTINVDADVYAESVTINKSLTLKGANAGVNPVTGTRGAESVVTGVGNNGKTAFYVTANDVTIDGFTVEGATNSNQFGYGLLLGAGTSDSHILNNIIQNNIAGLALANNSTTAQTVIQHNLFRNNNQPGPAGGTDIYADEFTAGAGGVKNVLIDGNTFTNTSFVENAWALGMSNTGATPFSGITFSNNNVTNHGRGVYFFGTTSSSVNNNTITGASRYAIGLLGSNGTPANSLFTISNNTLDAAGSGGAGVKLVNDTSAAAYTGALTLSGFELLVLDVQQQIVKWHAGNIDFGDTQIDYSNVTRVNLLNARSTVADAVGVDVSAVEGNAFTGVVATFTDPTGIQTVGDYSATVIWGDQDGTGHPLTSQGTVVALGGGHYQVVGSHIYAKEGSYALSVSITASDASTTNTSVAFGSSASVVLSPTKAPGTWYPDRYAPAGFTPGQTAGGRVGVLDEFISSADKNGSRPPVYNSGFYDFQGRKYDLAAGTTYFIADLYVPASWSSLVQKDPSGNPANWGSLASVWATGVDASSSAVSFPIIGFNNTAGTGTGGFRVFDQTNGWTNVTGFTGADQWYQLGITIQGGQIEYLVNGQVVYTDAAGGGATALGNVILQGYNGGNDYHIYWGGVRDTRAIVANAPLTAGKLTPPAATMGVSTGKVVLFHFTDANPGSTAGEYTATVVWGDGSSNTSADGSGTVSVVASAAGGFDVIGSHTYLAELTNRTFIVSVSDAAGATTSASDTAFHVADAPLTAGALTPPVNPALGTPISHQVLFHFTDADPNGKAGDYMVTVSWGDGSVETNLANPASVQVVASGDGFDVIGFHTYTAGAAGLTFQVWVADHAAPVGGTATVDVSTDVIVHGTADGDSLVLLRTPGGAFGAITYVLNGGAPVALTNATSFTFFGGAGVTTMTVNFVNGAPLPGAIHFDGGDGANTLVVDADGRAARTASGDITILGGPQQDIRYANVQATHLNDLMAVNASYGPNTADRDSLVGLGDNARFVQALYLAELGRSGDLTEARDAGHWVAALDSGTLTRLDVAEAIASSAEAQNRLVRAWYQTYLGREAQGGEEQHWVSQLAQGHTEEQVLSGILASDEFLAHAQAVVGAGTQDERYVQCLYQQLLNRAGAAAEVAYWVDQVPQVGREEVARSILGAAEFRADQFEGYYNALLHRPGEPGTLEDWVFSDFDLNAVRLGFEASDEFFANG